MPSASPSSATRPRGSSASTGEMRRAALLAGALFASAALAQYPSRPVRFIVPSSAGGGTDIIARALAQKLSEAFGQQFVVDNRPGAGQMIGLEMAAKAPPDGHTLVMAASTLALNAVMYKKVPYDALRDFAAITQAATVPNVLVVHPSLPAKTITELVSYARVHRASCPSPPPVWALRRTWQSSS